MIVTLYADIASPQFLCAGFGATIQEGYKAIRELLKESSKMVKGLERKPYEEILFALTLLVANNFLWYM